MSKENQANQALAAAVGNRAPVEASNKPRTLTSLMADPKIKNQMALALPKHVSADRLARIALTEIRKTPKLATCSQESFLGAIMQCAQLGLEPGNALGHAYLLPFEKRQKINGQWQTVETQVQLIIGYRGMIDLARRSGQIVSLSAYTAHANDDFNYQLGLNPNIHHIPANGDRGATTHVYAVAKLKDGGVQFEVMSLHDVEQVRKSSKASNDGPWVTHFDEMAKKTAIRRLFKYLPVSIEMQTAIGLDERADAGLNQDNASVLTGDYQVMDDDQVLLNQETGEVTKLQEKPQDDLLGDVIQ